MTNTALKAQIDSQITNETLPSSISPADVGGNLKAVVDYTDQQVGTSSVVKLLLTQTGTDAPTATVARNTFASDPTYSRNSAGKFTIFMPAGSLTGKTIICTATSGVDSPYIMSISQSGGATVALWAKTDAGVYSDELIDISITIEAY